MTGNIRKRSERAKTARVKHFRPVKIGGYLNTREAAVLSCGCSIFVGISSDTKQAATAGQPCKEGHQALIDLANALLQQRLTTPDPKKLMVDLCVDVLTEAAHTF